jgi:succinyl-CoA synthetase beta subunit
MDLYEHQGKDLFAAAGIELAPAQVARTPEEARAAAERLGGRVAIKAQVQVGGRGKGGGIAFVGSAGEAEDAARRILEGGFKGMPVTRVLVEALVDLAGESYAAITLDRSSRTYMAMVSSEGGVDIEEIARTNPGALRLAPIDPLLGLKRYAVRYLTGHLPEPARPGTAALLPKLWEVLTANDATLVEVNPLALLTDGRAMPLDAKVTIDDNALFRHPELAELKAGFPVDPTQAKADEKGLQYVKLDGEVGIIGNGAGLVMATLDVVTQAGGRPANFLDVGGGASADEMATSLEVVVSDPAVGSILVNIFGGITRCDVVAEGILSAVHNVPHSVQIVVRLDGTRAEQGRLILAEANDPRITPATTMLEAAATAVEFARSGEGRS